MLAHLHPIADQRGRNPKYVCYYELFEKEINIDGIEYPVKLADINQFQGQNPSILVSVFILANDNYNLAPTRIGNKRCENHLQWGLLTGKNGETHYFLIKNFSALVSTQISKHDGKN